MFARKRIYLDHASSTPVAPAASHAVRRAQRAYANPGGIHADAVEAKKLLQSARERIAEHLACKPRELIFTSGLTESNAIAIVGAARALERARRSLEGTHWIATSIEHSSVLECFAEVERMGGNVTLVEPDGGGIVRPEAIARALRSETVFVSIGWANNEIGVVQPLAQIARVIRAHEILHKSDLCRIIFHSDAGQAPLYFPAQVHTLGVDLLALGSGKLYGPRGIGCLYLSNRAQLAPLSFGGAQERGLRSGTEDVALAAGFAEAFDVIARERGEESERLRKMRDGLARELAERIPLLVINGDLKHALPHLLNISVPGQKSGEYLVLQMDHAGISLSTKSACREGENASHVVAALAAAAEASAKAAENAWRATNTMRFSFGRETTARELRYAAEMLIKIAGADAAGLI